MKPCQLAFLTDVDDADVAGAHRAAIAAQPRSNGLNGEILAVGIDQRLNGDPFHALAVRADGVELKAFYQVAQSLHAVYIYSYAR